MNTLGVFGGALPMIPISRADFASATYSPIPLSFHPADGENVILSQLGAIWPADIQPLWLGAAGLALLALVALVAWNLSLRRRLAQGRPVSGQDEKAAQLERRCAEFIENATDVVYTRDLDGNYTSINPAGESLLGYSRDEFLRMNVSQIVVSEQMEHIRQQTAKLYAEGHVVYEVQMRAKDGRLLWLETSLRMLMKDGKPAGVQGIARDVTERHNAAQHLRESELHYHSLVEQLPQAIVHKDRDGHVTFANSRYCQMIGRPLADVIGKTDFDLLQPEQAQQSRADDLRIMETGGVIEATDRHIDERGQERYLQTLRFPLHDAAGRIAGVQCLTLDVTERKRADEAIQSSRQRHSLHVDQTPLAVIEWDLYFQVTAWNASAERIFGYTAAEALGHHAAELIVPKNVRPHVNKIWDALVSQRGGSRSTNKNVTKDGRDIICEWYNTPILDASGNVVAVASLVQDVTERHEAEKARGKLEVQLRQAQKMEAVGQLAGGVAHDFNNILTVVLGNARLLNDEPGLSPAAKAKVDELIRAGEQASTLTHQLLTFSRRNIMETHLADLNVVLTDVTQMLTRLIGEDISLECECAPHSLAVRIDASLIGQVIVNLVVNARDAMPSGGSLKIGTGLKTVSAEQAHNHPDAHVGQFATLYVADTGCGMSETIRSHLFEPFFTTKEIGKGSGLGLSVAYGIIKQHGGWIECNSAVSQGSTFTIYLPVVLDSPSASKDAKPPTTAPRAGSETILVVEDEPSVSQFVRTCLEKEDYRVLVASSGTEALRQWESVGGAIDLLMTDMVLPGGLSGNDLATQLRAVQPGLRIIFSSGYSPDYSGSDIEQSSGAIFLQKPYSPNTLIKTVRRCLDATVSRRGDGEPVEVSGPAI